MRRLWSSTESVLMPSYRDLALERELCLGGLHPAASRRVFGDVTAYVQKPIEQVAREYWAYHQGEDLAAQQRVGDATDEAQVLAYYHATPHYLYELSYWEASHDKQAWFEVVFKACKKYRLKRVLDFGGGVGGLSVYLNGRGIRCDYEHAAYAIQWLAFGSRRD